MNRRHCSALIAIPFILAGALPPPRAFVDLSCSPGRTVVELLPRRRRGNDHATC